MTPPPSAMMGSQGRLRIGYDATACLGLRTGVGRFAHEVLARIAAEPDLDVSAFVVSWRGRDSLASIAPPRVRVVQRPMAARPLRMAWVRFDHPRIETWTGPLDVVHGPNYVVPPTHDAARVITVHDLTPLHFPELANADTRVYPTLIQRAVKAGAWVQTPSQFIRGEVIDAFGVDPARVIAVPYGVTPLDPDDQEATGSVGKRIVGADRYVLALGTVEPRKDLVSLIDSFDLLAGVDPTVRLAIAGQDGWGADAVTGAIARAKHRARIVRLGSVSETERAALLRGAAVLAYPSRYEGFGLPPLEAMDAGVPVVCTDAGSLPEVLGDAVTYVDADVLAEGGEDGPRALSKAIARTLDDDALRAELIERGRVRAAEYSWDHTASEIARLYRRAVAER